MKTYFLNDLSETEINNLTRRTAIELEKITSVVKPILKDIKKNGIHAVIKYAKQFDGFESDRLLVSKQEFDEAEQFLVPKIKNAILTAAQNIKNFHLKQLPVPYSIETMTGVNCSREFRAIENVGLYIPGGSAVLPSTMLMLGIPATLAGCKRIVVCSPSKNSKINAPLLYTAKLCGINEFYKIGGAQAIGLLAYGGKDIPKVNKIFGPGNQYITAAKLLVSIEASGCSIDMPAGPSEVLVVADGFANPSFVAADLLSQAEHGVDSQVVLITNSAEHAKKIIAQINIQIAKLPRREIASKALGNSFALVVNDIEQAINFSNMYAPEHLILNVENPEKLISKIVNAGSVFLGQYSPVSVGDYASGTNHSLPTYGYAKVFGGVTVEMFMKSLTFQNLTKEGLSNISETVETLAEVESLLAHKNAVGIRLK
mgnify:CR=1 FL=1